MKKIFLFIAIISAFISNSQVRQPQTLGSPMTDVYSKGTIGSDSGYVYRSNFPDTVNVGLIKNIPGVVIRVGNILYLRNQTVNAWIQIGVGGGGSGIREVIAGYGLTQINDSTFQFSTALRDSIIGLIPGGGSINISDSITQFCPIDLNMIEERSLIVELIFGQYLGFPSITKTKLNTLLLHYYYGYGHADSGTLRARRSYDYAQTYTADTIFQSEKDSNWRSWEVASLWQNDKTQTADTIITQTWTEAGNLYFWTSVDDAINWSARQQIITGRKTASQGKVVKFKGKWVMPVYFFGAFTQTGGIIHSSDAGATWSAPVLFDSTYGKPNEINLLIKGDSLIAFARTDTPSDTMWRYASIDGLVWGPQTKINVPLTLAGKPAVHMMDDGRILLNARIREIPSVTPDNAHIFLSDDGGFNFTSLHVQTYDWNYGSFEYIGGDRYINVYGARITSGHTEIVQSDFTVPRCQVFVDGIEVEKPGDPLAPTEQVTIPGVNNDILFSDGNGAVKVVSGFDITGSRTNLLYVANTEGTGTNSQLFADASSAIGTGAMAGGPGADATNTFALAIGPFTDVSGQSGTGIGYSNVVSSLRGTAIGYNNTVSHIDAIIIGAGMSSDKQGQFMVANATGINEVVFGKGSTSTQPEAVTIRPTNASGTDVIGGDLILQGGRNTNLGRGGYIGFNTSSIAGSTGSTLQTAIERMRIHGDSVEVKTNFFLNRTTVGDGDDSILVKGADKKVYTISQNDFASSVNDTVVIVTPFTGHQLAYEISPDSLFIKSLVAGSGVTLTDNGDSTITIASTAEANTASNLGGGLANYSTKVGVDLQFNSFLASHFNLVGNVIESDTATLWPLLRATIPAGAGGANTALSNLASVAINTSLLPGSNDGAALGSGTLSFSDLFLASGGVINFNNGNFTITHATGELNFSGNVGLGVSPAQKLHISGGDIFVIDANSSPRVLVGDGTGSGLNGQMRWESTLDALQFGTQTGGANTMTISETNNVGISTDVPTARLHLPAGTTASGSGPQKYTSGTSMTTAEAGAVEMTTDDLFFTITTGAARKRFLFADATAGLTSGTVPVATTNGRLTDGLIISAAPYTPTLTDNPAGYNSNAASSSHIKSYYTRVGNIVTVYGSIEVTATAGSTNTAVAVTLPVASALTAVTDVTGTSHWNVTVGINYQNFDGDVQGDATNDRAIISFFSHTATALHQVEYSFSYEIK